MELLETIRPPERLLAYPFRFPIRDRYKDGAAVSILGKIESGTVKKGDQVLLMPAKVGAGVGFRKDGGTECLGATEPKEANKHVIVFPFNYPKCLRCNKLTLDLSLFLAYRRALSC